MWQCWIIFILGIWLIISSFVLVKQTMGGMINNLMVGIIITLLALWASYSGKGKKTPSEGEETPSD